MKQLFISLLLIGLFCFSGVCTVNAKIMNENSGSLSIRGKVSDTEDHFIAGASVFVSGTTLGIHSNERGEYILSGLSSGKITLRASFLGYEAQTMDVDLQSDKEINFILEKKIISLEAVTVTAQQREQQVLDIPITMSVISRQALESNHIHNMEQLSDFVPGMNVRVQTPHRPNIAIRGLTSDETSPTAQPRVSTYFNNVSVSRASMALTEMFDMERIEVMKGPQGTLFGRGSQIGAINFITQKPGSTLGGYVSAGFGNYAMTEIEGALNIPVIENKLLTRFAGIYSYQDGYVTNTSGGKLNGKNTFGGRFSARYMPTHDLKFDLTVNYQKDDNPGTAFMSKRFPDANGVKDIFKYEASLDEGKKWFNKRDVLGTTLDGRYYINENSYISSLTSYHTNTVDHHYDGDGTPAPAIDMAEYVDANQFSQEFRYNFSLNSRLDGFIGASYWREKVDYRFWFGPDEQYMSYLILQMPQYLINENGSLGYPMPTLPDMPSLGPLAGMPLPTNHQEENNSGAINQSTDLFMDATFKLLPKLSLTAGIRGMYESFKATRKTEAIGTVPSTLGFLTGAYPNLFLSLTPYAEITDNFLSLTYRANLKYDISNFSNVYLGYAKGHRPKILQFTSAGEKEILNAENVHSFDAGFKWTAQQRYWFDLGIFYHRYNNFQTTRWDAGQYISDDAGKATSYGAEVTARAALTEYLEAFGNYAYIHARFDNDDSNGNGQQYAGKTFRHTPENSFLIGLNVKANLTKKVRMIFTPTYSWRSLIWFEDSNDMQPEDTSLDRLKQDAYGLLNLNLAFKLDDPNLTLSLFASNLLNQEYLIGAGNTGMMFGVPTYVPGAPRMIGAKLKWNF